MDVCDALIVGGGPAGSTVARALVQQGRHVAILDRSTFPREKPCAGWITPVVLDRLGVDPLAYAEGNILQPVTSFQTGILGAPMQTTHFDEVVSYGVRRMEFDDALLHRSGADLHLGEPLMTLVRDGTDWIVNDRLRTPLLVGAGGHRCPVARLLAPRSMASDRVIAAQEVEWLMTDAQQATCPVRAGEPELYFCDDVQGYGWVFRKGPVLNVGLGRRSAQDVAPRVAAFCDWLVQTGRLPADWPARLRGHAYLAYPEAHRPLTGDGVLLIGDAAGMAYADSGEGILPAILSAQLAAQTILAANGTYDRAALAPYASAVQRAFGVRERATGAPTPRPWRRRLAHRLLTQPWFTKQVLLRRWFLRHDAAMPRT